MEHGEQLPYGPSSRVNQRMRGPSKFKLVPNLVAFKLIGIEGFGYMVATPKCFPYLKKLLI